jgi:hypothetical protein
MRNSLLCIALLACGCGDGGEEVADAAPSYDARQIVRTERAYILTKITLPTTVEEVEASSHMFPGTEFPVNKMGGLTSVMLDLVKPIDPVATTQGALDDGTVLHAWIIDSGPLDETDPGATADFAILEDVDDPADPSNNFSGTAQLRIAAGEQRVDAITAAELTGGELEGHGDADSDSWGYAIKMHPLEPPLVIPGVYARIRVTIDESGFTGATASAMTTEQLHTVTYPAIAELLTYAVEQGVPRAAEITGIFDSNTDGVITTQELIENDTMASLSSPDVDLDGDGVNDHISQGVLIEAVPFELVE